MTGYGLFKGNNTLTVGRNVQETTQRYDFARGYFYEETDNSLTGLRLGWGRWYITVGWMSDNDTSEVGVSFYPLNLYSSPQKTDNRKLTEALAKSLGLK